MTSPESAGMTPNSGKLVIRDARTFRRLAGTLGRGDTVVGILPLTPAEERLVAILSERGVRFLPSISSQLLGRSKVLQAMILGRWMIPGTRVIQARRDLVAAMAAMDAGQVVTKRDRRNCGLGINLWPDVESLFNHVTWCLGPRGADADSPGGPYPFVLQPFIEGAKDVRVIVVGDYVEAYSRSGPHGFRNNMHFGGHSTPVVMRDDKLELCREIMRKAGFPFAHIDFLVKDGKWFLSEIAMNGGLKGASITAQELARLKGEILERLLAEA